MSGRQTTGRARLLGGAAAGAAAGALAAAGAAAVVVRRRPELVRRARRSARVWRLSARRGSHWVVVKLGGWRADEARRAELEERFAVRTAEDVAAELGQMKGALMKLGQLASVIADGLPEPAREALATLQADVPPMAPSLAEEVVRSELGAGPDRLLLDWDPVPVAAASIGQVHRAVTRDGREVAVKVQYPGAAEAIRHDLDNAEALYGMASALAFRGLDARALVDELRERMGEELDYRLEAAHQERFCRRFAGHPFIRVPAVVPELSAERVLTSEWVEGWSWAELERRADEPLRQDAAEVVFRFAQSAVHRYRELNGDPHPGNYRFHPDGTVTFLDFGLVKRWDDGDDFERLFAVLDPVLDQRVDDTVAAMVDAGFLAADHGLDPQAVFDSVSAPYEPYLHETFTFTPGFTAETMRAVGDPTGPHAAVTRVLNLPPSFVVLNRVVWGVSALLGRLGATNRWRAILDEYRLDGPPATGLGRLEHAWRDAGPAA